MTHLNAETMETFIVCSRLVACHANKGGKDSVFESVKPSSFISLLLNMMSEFQSSLQWFQSKCLQAFKHNMVQGLVQSQNFWSISTYAALVWKLFQNWQSS